MRADGARLRENTAVAIAAARRAPMASGLQRLRSEAPMSMCKAAPFLIVLAVSGCATSGIATGSLVSAQGEELDPIVFGWESERMDPVRGAIATTLPDGTRFHGRYFQITSEAVGRSFGYDPWLYGRYPGNRLDYGYGFDNFDTYTTIYSGRVIATLDGPDRRRMRCEFTLADPDEGLAGGGTGACRLNDGERITDVVLREGEPPDEEALALAD